MEETHQKKKKTMEEITYLLEQESKSEEEFVSDGKAQWRVELQTLEMELFSYSISSSFSKQHIIMMLENILEDTVDHSLGASLSLSLHLLRNHEFNCNYDL